MNKRERETERGLKFSSISCAQIAIHNSRNIDKRRLLWCTVIQKPILLPRISCMYSCIILLECALTLIVYVCGTKLAPYPLWYCQPSVIRNVSWEDIWDYLDTVVIAKSIR